MFFRCRPSAAELSEIEGNLRRHVDMLAGVIGERNVPNRYGALEGAARYVEDTLRKAGHSPVGQEFSAHGKPVRNIEVEMRGARRPERVWVMGRLRLDRPESGGQTTTRRRWRGCWRWRG